MKVNINGLTIGKNYIISCEVNGKNCKSIPKYKIGVCLANDGTPIEAEIKEEGLVTWRLLKIGKLSTAAADIESVIQDLMKKLDAYHLEKFGEAADQVQVEEEEEEGENESTYAHIVVNTNETENIYIDYFKAPDFNEALKEHSNYNYTTNKLYLDNLNIDKDNEVAWTNDITSSPILSGEYEGVLEDISCNFEMVINVEKNIGCNMYKEILNFNNNRGLIDTTLSASNKL